MSLKPCEKCSCSGIYITWVGYSTGIGSTGQGAIPPYTPVACPVCKGKGWIDDSEGKEQGA